MIISRTSFGIVPASIHLGLNI